MAYSEEQSLVIYNHCSPFTDSLQLEERIFTFFNKNLKIKQQWSPNGKGGTDIGFGASVYHCAIALSLYLECNSVEILNKTVVEVGCGPGLVSLVCAAGGN